MKTTIELRQDRAALVKQAREILDVADEESRELTAEERVKYDKIHGDIDKLGDRIKDEERQAALEKELDDPAGNPAKPEPENRGDPQHKTETDEYRDAFRSFLFTGDDREFRALQVDSDPAGGYTVPMQFGRDVILKKKDLVWLRQRATVIELMNAGSLGNPALDTEPEDATWTGEINTRDEDTAMAFGKRELNPNALAKLLKVSKKLLRSSAIDIEGLIRDRMAYKFAVTEENAFLNGTGALQPLGLFTASDEGISTSRDISTGNTTTAITGDGLKEAKYGLKMQYRQNAAWIFHRDGVKQIDKLKDGEGRYLMQPVTRTAGSLDQLLSYPVYESEYAPSTFTTGLYVGILGDFSFYWIADSLAISIQRLVELYAATGQDGFIATQEADGMPVLEEAFARVTLA